ncbi:hypothetical protein MJH12_10670, partial [bacterium]|nr:hypothetical protein [bacterium]
MNLILFSFMLISCALCLEYYKAALALFILLFFVLSNVTTCHYFQFEARLSTTKSNLYAIKSSIAMYRSRNDKVPF